MRRGLPQAGHRMAIMRAQSNSLVSLIIIIAIVTTAQITTANRARPTRVQNSMQRHQIRPGPNSTSRMMIRRISPIPPKPP